MNEQQREAIIAERDAVLLSLDAEQAKTFIRAHGGKVPSGRVNWDQVLHVARFECMSIPAEARTDSHIWLAQNGAQSLATLPPESKCVRAALDLLFPPDMFAEVMAEWGQPV